MLSRVASRTEDRAQNPASASPSTGPVDEAMEHAQRVQRVVLEERSVFLEEFNALSRQVKKAELTLRDISSLSQMFTEQVLQQGRQIEQLYEDALRATLHIEKGNEQLRKTVDVKRSSRLYLLVFIAVATFGVLFLDWFYG
jgi:syntaxin 18